MSVSNDSKSDNPDFSEIENAAEAAEDSIQQTTTESRLTTIEDRLASSESLLEQLQANSALGTKINDYIDDLRAEQVFFNRARYAIGGISVVTICLLIALLMLSLFHSKSPLLAANPLAIATFIVGLVSGIALMINSFVKGVFRSTTERHADGFLPPALEKGVELVHKVTGKN